ncbi:Protein EFR3 B [Nymphon striatum]|nr:Protein EFR3 B [Nymphon striatum]
MNIFPVCCNCCYALRPRYKRLVDNIFPENPEDGLMRNNMEKLTFYALSSPEKLDRIGEYLAQRVSRDISSRHRIRFAVIAMEAMDQLLVACHAQTLNLFVESFLKMVQKLLECDAPDLQMLATKSFVRFAHIKEDTPSYHRRYDFFVSKFSSMCHNNSDPVEVRKSIRLAGLEGLQGVVRKTISDDLQVNIWEHTHMDKIVPSLLFNMQDAQPSSEIDGRTDGEDNPPTLAEACLRELSGRATFGNIKSIIKPVLRHLDNHRLWDPNNFAVSTFRIIMFSIQAQYAHSVIQILLRHLEEQAKADARVRTGITNVLCNIVTIAAAESVGPSVLDVFNSLLNQLRKSVVCKKNDEKAKSDEKQYQEAIINTLGEFANNLPDYQKIEIMVFILGKVPFHIGTESGSDDDTLLQNMLLKSILKVATKYMTVFMVQTFSQAFLDPLLRISLATDSGARLLVQKILHTLLDRHDNLPRLRKPSVSGKETHLIIEKCPSQDKTFIRKHGSELFLHLYENLEMITNMKENYESLYVTLVLLTIELGAEEFIIELLRFILAVQEMANTPGFKQCHRFALHAVVASYMYFLQQLLNVSAFTHHVEKVIANRREEAPGLLPDIGVLLSPPSAVPLSTDLTLKLLFDKNVIIEILRNGGYDVNHLLIPYTPGNPTVTAGKLLFHVCVAGENDFKLDASVTRSTSDLNLEIDSEVSSAEFIRRYPEEEITVESLKRMMAAPSDNKKELEEERQHQILERFKTASFTDLVQRYEELPSDHLQNKLHEILGGIIPSVHTPMSSSMCDISSRPGSPHHSSGRSDECHKQAGNGPYLICDIKFPDLFVF